MAAAGKESDRRCGWCGADINAMSPRAEYCSTLHKKAAAAKRHRERNPGYYARYANSPARTAYRTANAELLRSYAREQQRRYRDDHPGAAAAWWAANPERRRLYQAARRCRESAGPGVSERDWLRLVRRFGHRCAYCGIKPETLHMDHVVPLRRGGRHSIGNVLPACPSCNSSKGAQLHYRWTVRVRLTRYAVSLQGKAA